MTIFYSRARTAAQHIGHTNVPQNKVDSRCRVFKVVSSGNPLTAKYIPNLLATKYEIVLQSIGKVIKLSCWDHRPLKANRLPEHRTRFLQMPGPLQQYNLVCPTTKCLLLPKKYSQLISTPPIIFPSDEMEQITRQRQCLFTDKVFSQQKQLLYWDDPPPWRKADTTSTLALLRDIHTVKYECYKLWNY